MFRQMKKGKLGEANNHGKQASNEMFHTDKKEV